VINCDRDIVNRKVRLIRELNYGQIAFCNVQRGVGTYKVSRDVTRGKVSIREKRDHGERPKGSNWLAPYERAFARDTKTEDNEFPIRGTRICALLCSANTSPFTQHRETRSTYRYLSRETSSRFLVYVNLRTTLETAL